MFPLRSMDAGASYHSVYAETKKFQNSLHFIVMPMRPTAAWPFAAQ
jgi:hypothetical protein